MFTFISFVAKENMTIQLATQEQRELPKARTRAKRCWSGMEFQELPQKQRIETTVSREKQAGLTSHIDIS